MDDSERVPIDLGYEQVSPQQAAALGSARAVTREDGTLVIDILVEQPCGSGVGGEIVVCAPAGSPEQRLPAARPAPHAPTMMQQIGDALKVEIGPLELGSIEQADGSKTFGARVRF